VPELSPGDRVADDLVLVRPLIKGGMGSVWVARHERLQSEVAVKLLSGNFTDDDIAKKRFAREAAAAMEVQSPHVVQMLDYGIRDDGVPYIVMELLAGEDLEGQLGRGRLPPREVLSIVTQTGQALHRAHEHGILHRDVKPANVFLVPADGFSGEKYFVKLLDFGFAKRVDRITAQLTEQGTVVGTPRYMSPEQMMGQELDARSDLFSLGAVAFEAFTGAPAFPGATLREIADAIQKRPTPRPTAVDPSLPRGLDEWFSKACARDRYDRFSSAREMIEALQQVFAARVTGSDEDEPAPEGRIIVTGRPSRFTRISVVVALALATIALVVWIVRR
jgi:serine/threonine-protein kinase